MAITWKFQTTECQPAISNDGNHSKRQFNGQQTCRPTVTSSNATDSKPRAQIARS